MLPPPRCSPDDARPDHAFFRSDLAMNIELLAQMVNDIADYFVSDPDHANGVRSISEHLTKFWDPVMRRQIVEHLRNGGAGLQPMAREAVQQLLDVQATAEN